MIVWGKQEGHVQESKSPYGYIIAFVPYLEKCHLVASFSGKGEQAHIGQVRDIRRGYTPELKKAARELRAACDRHLADPVSFQPYRA